MERLSQMIACDGSVLTGVRRGRKLALPYDAMRETLLPPVFAPSAIFRSPLKGPVDPDLVSMWNGRANLYASMRQDELNAGGFRMEETPPDRFPGS
jgi:hypothetical protein